MLGWPISTLTLGGVDDLLAQDAGHTQHRPAAVLQLSLAVPAAGRVGGAMLDEGRCPTHRLRRVRRAGQHSVQGRIYPCKLPGLIG